MLQKLKRVGRFPDHHVGKGDHAQTAGHLWASTLRHASGRASPLLKALPRKNTIVSIAAANAHAASKSNTDPMLWVASRILPITAGLTYPARLPTELIQAIPAGAAAAVRIVVGSAQQVA